jgi:hypothetical protein
MNRFTRPDGPSGIISLRTGRPLVWDQVVPCIYGRRGVPGLFPRLHPVVHGRAQASLRLVSRRIFPHSLCLRYTYFPRRWLRRIYLRILHCAQSSILIKHELNDMFIDNGNIFRYDRKFVHGSKYHRLDGLGVFRCFPWHSYSLGIHRKAPFPSFLQCCF